jgi:hypothetical protein
VSSSQTAEAKTVDVSLTFFADTFPHKMAASQTLALTEPKCPSYTCSKTKRGDGQKMDEKQGAGSI